VAQEIHRRAKRHEHLDHAVIRGQSFTGFTRSDRIYMLILKHLVNPVYNSLRGFVLFPTVCHNSVPFAYKVGQQIINQ
jgi:hypothetical protein